MLTLLSVSLRVVSMVVVGGVAPPSFSHVMLGSGTLLAVQDSVILFHSRAVATDGGSERMNEFAVHKGTQ